MKFSIPIKTINELNAHAHWRTRHKRAKMQRHIVRMFLGQRRVVPPPMPMRITFTRIAPGNGLDPGDGLPSAFKAIRDELADIIGVNDRSPLYEWVYAQRRGEAKEYGVEIELEAKVNP